MNYPSPALVLLNEMKTRGGNDEHTAEPKMLKKKNETAVISSTTSYFCLEPQAPKKVKKRAQ